MKKKLYHIIFFILTLGSNAVVSGQDIHFSQFFEAPLLRNPSLAGIFTGDIRIQTVYRDQWNSMTDAFKTFSLNGEYKMPVGKGSDFLTTGLQILHDRAGTVSWVSTQVLPALNFHKSLSNDRNRYLSLGFMGGFVQRNFDRTKMTTNSQYDGMGDGEILLKPLYTYLDVSVGMSYNSQIGENPNNNFFLGAAYHHLNKPKNSFYRNGSAELEPKWVASAGIRLAVTPISYLTIQADHSRQGQFMETVGGALYGIKIGDDWDKPLYTIHGGAFLRWNDALIPVIKLDYAPFSAAFSYDVNLSKLKTSSYGRGGFELSISYIGFINREIESLNCPRF